MEANSILNAFVVSANQYASSQTEHNLLYLQRHLDIVMGLTTSSSDLDFFDPSQMVVTECVSCFINILLNTNNKSALIQRVLSILQNIVKKETLQEYLQSTFRLHSTLSMFLQKHGMSMKDPLVIQCLQLLEIVTYNISLSYIENHLENLINILLKQIDNKSSEVFIPALHILSNLCRHNLPVQNYICNLPNLKQVYKSFVSKLCCPDQTAIIYALSVLASLTSSNDMFEKLFTSKHSDDAFELVVILLKSSDKNSSNAALNLLLDLLEISQIQQYIIRYSKLDKVLQTIVDTCSSENSIDQSSRYLKFLWAFVKIPETKRHVSSVLSQTLRHNDDTLVESNVIGIHPALIKWAGEMVENPGDAPRIALQIIKCVVETYLDEKFESVETCLKDLLKLLLNKMTHIGEFNFSKKQLQTQGAFFDFLFLICQKTSLGNFVSQHLEIRICENIVRHQLEWNPLSFKEKEKSELGVDLLLVTIGTVAAVKESLSGANEFLHSFLQESRIMPFISFALNSTCTERVNRGLFIVSLNNPGFPLQILGESISATNSSRQYQQNMCDSGPDVSFDSESITNCFNHIVVKTSKMHIRRDSVDRNVESLIHKIESGLELKDLKSSEIMDMYEHKISALRLKEQELQNFVQAKTAALQQADRILSQYKCRQAQSETEALKLRSLMKESEKRSETSKEQANQAIQKYLQLQKEFNEALLQIRSLEQHNEEQREAIAEHMQRQTALQKALENLQAEYNSLSEMHAMLLRHSESMKQKQDLMTAQILEFETDKKNLSKQLKEKDLKLKEFCQQVQKLEESLKKKEDDYLILESSKAALQKVSDKTEKMKCKLQQEVASLELICGQHETTIKEKDTQIKTLTEELDKHKYITGMIHEISSGKATVGGLINK